jgi:hypothetical protein
VANGFNIHINDNIIDGCFDSGIAIRDTLYAISGSGYEVNINNNTITNTKSSLTAQTGYGIYIPDPSRYVVHVNNNTFSNNPGGDCVY